MATRVPYYTQIITVEGVNIKANEAVDPAAVQAGADVVGVMLSGRADIAKCMARMGRGLGNHPQG